jgi:hypothetical protein
MELEDDGHDDGDGQDDDQGSKLGKKKEKNKIHEIKSKVLIEFCFCQSRHHRGCDIGFRIDSHTIKRGDLIVNADI